MLMRENYNKTFHITGLYLSLLDIDVTIIMLDLFNLIPVDFISRKIDIFYYVLYEMNNTRTNLWMKLIY